MIQASPLREYLLPIPPPRAYRLATCALMQAALLERHARAYIAPCRLWRGLPGYRFAPAVRPDRLKRLRCGARAPLLLYERAQLVAEAQGMEVKRDSDFDACLDR